MFSLNSKPNLCRFLLLFVYNSIAVGDAIVKRMGRVGILLTGLTPPQFCTCPMTGTGFIASYYVMVFFYVQSFEVKGDYFVHICCIVDYLYHCLSFLYISKI